LKKKIRYVIVQAGGGGSRMGHLTENKPKALLSIGGQPLIIRMMRLASEAEFLVIADYKGDVLEKYLNIYAPVKYHLIRASGKGTCSGIKESLNFIPDREPFLVVGCDLYFEKKAFLGNLNLNENNYIGLSKTFSCRWSFNEGALKEERSNSCGVAGVFIFKDKNEISDISPNGEFCSYLRNKDVNLKTFYLQNIQEVGALSTYEEITKSFANTRPFNKLILKDNLVIKKPVDEQGERLAQYEKNWYRETEKYQYCFIPKIIKYHPLTMERIDGKSLFRTSLPNKEKVKILRMMVKRLQQIHSSGKLKRGNFFDNNYEAIIEKTKRRLDSIISLIPNGSSDEFIFISGKKCLNFYKKWDIVETLLPQYFPDEYKLIHGDSTFSNTLYENRTQEVYFIDPRGYYGKMLLYGDEDYDWAKLYYSLVGNYDQFNIKNFRLRLDNKKVIIDIASNGWEYLEKDFFKMINRNEEKIKFYHAIIWLSLTTYAWDNYDSICSAFYNGIYLMQNAYEKTF
jgi:GTP:adenosylcobinamide-phosphate guanylyltransferase